MPEVHEEMVFEQNIFPGSKEAHMQNTALIA
jgi:hypothetical protein